MCIACESVPSPPHHTTHLGCVDIVDLNISQIICNALGLSGLIVQHSESKWDVYPLKLIVIYMKRDIKLSTSSLIR